MQKPALRWLIGSHHLLLSLSIAGAEIEPQFSPGLLKTRVKGAREGVGVAHHRPEDLVYYVDKGWTAQARKHPIVTAQTLTPDWLAG